MLAPAYEILSPYFSLYPVDKLARAAAAKFMNESIYIMTQHAASSCYEMYIAVGAASSLAHSREIRVGRILARILTLEYRQEFLSVNEVHESDDDETTSCTLRASRSSHLQVDRARESSRNAFGGAAQDKRKNIAGIRRAQYPRSGLYCNEVDSV